jgi:hypothetical protein
MTYTQLLKDAWLMLEHHPILLLPQAFAILLSGLWFALVNILVSTLNTAPLLGVTIEMSKFLLVMLYLLIQMILWLYFASVNYNLYSQIKARHHLKIKNIFRFNHDRFFHIAGVSMLIFTAILLPVVAIVILLFTYLFGEVSLYFRAISLALIVTWLLLVSWRLLFVFNRRHTERPAHHSMRAGFHFAKVLMRHVLISWLIVIELFLIIGVSGKVYSLLTATHVWLVAMGILAAIVAEIILAAWEHLVICELYVDVQHVKKKMTKKKSSRRKKRRKR